jgi:hypothetical protein
MVVSIIEMFAKYLQKSDGFSNENRSSAFPNRLFFNLIRKKAVSSTSQPGYRMIAA